METNQNRVQENSAQLIAHELEQPAERLYDPAEAARIVQCLTDGYFDPEYILLFGKLAGGTRHNVESTSTPFLFFAHAEGELLYCSDSYRFQRPKYPIDFAKAYADAKFHFDTFRTQGNELLEQAQDAFSESRNMRLATQFSAQAMVYFYHTLY